MTNTSAVTFSTPHRRHGDLCHQLRLTATRINSCTIIAVNGEVDASNAREVADYAVDRLDGCCQLRVDLSAVRFFGISGISALHKINAECAQRGVPWLLVPAAEVTRVLRLCDPEAVLPVAGNTRWADSAKGSHLQLLTDQSG